MKYGRIDAAAHKLDIIESDLFDSAERMCGLDPGKTDHGTIGHHPDVGGIGIVVAEFGLFVPPLNQYYFALDARLFAGNAMLYCYDEAGDTVDFDDTGLVTPRWFASGMEVARAITKGELIRPQLSVNGVVVWEWPQSRPDLERLSRRLT